MARRLGPIDIGGEPDPIARPNHDVALDPHRRGRAVHPLALPCPRAAFPLNPRAVPQVARARSSAGEHYVDIVGVTGSIPVAPTIPVNRLLAELHLKASDGPGKPASTDVFLSRAHQSARGAADAASAPGSVVFAFGRFAAHADLSSTPRRLVKPKP